MNGRWSSPVRKFVSLKAENQFTFLNVTREVSFPADWNNPLFEKLWLYNLHYFDYINPEKAHSCTSASSKIISQWIKDNPPGLGNGWEPYPLSLRIVNWIKWELSCNSLDDLGVHSLAIQVRFLEQKLEWHLLGNHLFANAKALIFAGLFFDGREADRWFSRGKRILEKQLPEQVLVDGGNFELTPMYHEIFLEDLLDLSNIARAYQCDELDNLQSVVSKMNYWLKAMTHPDGQISFFNDAAKKIAPEPNELFAYSKSLGVEPLEIGKGLIALEDSGYIRVENEAAVVLIDCARVGPDYIPGHAHADTLSFECSLFGERLIVNSGTSCYGISLERERQRSTPAHSTVTINNESSSEVWGGFRVARRAYPRDLSVRVEADEFYIKCSHDGYKRLKGRPIHTREVKVDNMSIEVTDKISGDFDNAIGRLYFSPEVEVRLEGDNYGRLVFDDRVVDWKLLGGEISLKDSTYHPEFGKSVPNKCIEYKIIERKSQFKIGWT